MSEKEIVFINPKDLNKFNEFNNLDKHEIHIHITRGLINDKDIYQVTIENLNRNSNDIESYLKSLSEKIDLL